MLVQAFTVEAETPRSCNTVLQEIEDLEFLQAFDCELALTAGSRNSDSKGPPGQGCQIQKILGLLRACGVRPDDDLLYTQRL